MDVVFAILFNKYICFLSTVKKNVNQIEVNKSKIKLLKAKIKLKKCLSKNCLIETDSFLTGKFTFIIKGTLMQIWKYPNIFVFIWKQYPANFVFLILRTLELFMREDCEFLKN